MGARLFQAAVLASAALLTLAGCAASGSSAYVGTWGGKDPEPNVTISEDWKVTGFDGCNRITGTGRPDGDRFVFGDLAQTMMACPDATDALEPWPEAARVDDDELVLLGGDGREVRRLPRQN